jgi:hypothetical protein
MTAVAVVGPGAIGATFAAAAERAGHTVALCGRRPGPPPVVERPDGQEHVLAGPVQEIRPPPSTSSGCCSRSRRTGQPARCAGSSPVRCRHSDRRAAERRRARGPGRAARGSGERVAGDRLVPRRGCHAWARAPARARAAERARHAGGSRPRRAARRLRARRPPRWRRRPTRGERSLAGRATANDFRNSALRQAAAAVDGP